jgi:hemolysin type calcium-binding protein/WD40 repeat protein
VTHDRTRLGWRVALVAVAAGLLFVPFSSGGGFTGRNGRIVVVTSTGDVDAITSSTSDTLASGATVGDSATLSPDRSKVAYTTGGANVHVHCLDGSCDVLLVAGSEPVWSPDGSTIAYVDASGHVSTIGVNADGTANGSAHDQTPSITTGEDPAWSPDGSQIAFANVRGTHTEIWKVAYAASAPPAGTLTQITTNSGTDVDREPTWSPDGTKIVFQSNRANAARYQLYSVASSAGAVTQITNDTSTDTDPVYSPDATEIAFTRSDGVYEVAPSGGTVTQIATLTNPETADWEVLVPVNTSPPTVTADDAPFVGQTVTASPGSWQGVDTTLSNRYEYEFLRCAADGSGCTAIGGFSTTSTYTLTNADAGYTIGVEVEASNRAGTSAPVGDTEPTNPVRGAGPSNVTPPVVTLGTVGGTVLTAPLVGTYVTATTGTWTGTGDTYAYQWKKCDPKTGFCFTISGATSSLYLVTADAYGYDLRVDVTATNDSGSTTAFSTLTAAVTGNAPVNSVSPQVSGVNQVGGLLTVSTGTWTGTTPLTYTYQWRRCNPQGDLATCKAIAGATSNTYTVQAADQGVALRAYVTATNVVGPVVAFTNHTFPILPAGKTPPPPTVSPVPANTTAPAVDGAASVGTVLTASAGVWTGKAPIRYTYRWQRCDPLGARCRAIRKATGKTYRLAKADLGSTVRVGVTARNSAGVKTAVSTITDTISLAKPVPKGRHVVGTNGPDYLPGGGGNDTVQGRGGNDTILGGAGDDRLFGGAGNDVIDGGPGKDVISGGVGNDTIRAADGVADAIDCGPGRDHATVDAIDVVKGCELVTVATATAPATP